MGEEGNGRKGRKGRKRGREGGRLFFPTGFSRSFKLARLFTPTPFLIKQANKTTTTKPNWQPFPCDRGLSHDSLHFGSWLLGHDTTLDSNSSRGQTI